MEDKASETDANPKLPSPDLTRLVFDRSSVALYACKPAGDFAATYISSNVEHMFGYSPNSFTLDPAFWSSHIHPDDRDQVFAGLTALFDNDHYVHSYRFSTVNAVYRWVRDELFLVRDTMGEPEKIVGLWFDISTEKANEERFRRIFDGAPTAMFICNEQGRLIRTNKALHQFLGYRDDELKTKTFDEFIHPDNVTASRTLFNELTRGKRQKYTVDHRFMRKDGSDIWGRASVSLQHDNVDETPKIITIVQDITDEKLASAQAIAFARRMEMAMRATCQALANIVEMRDPYTAGHQIRVAQLAGAIARKLNLDDDRVLGIEVGARLHDIGKIGVPAEILAFPGKLDTTQKKLVEMHCEAGFDMIADIEFPWPAVSKIILQHHERWDGSGYPHGLKDGEIELESAIVGVADVVEAIMSHRPYRPARGLGEALNHLRGSRDTLYDPKVVDACIELLEGGKFSFS